MLNNKEISFYVEKCIQKINTALFLCAADILIKSLQVYFYIEDNVINAIKNENAVKNIKVGEVWREYSDPYTNTDYSDWIILSLSKKKVTVSNIKDQFEFKVKEVEPRTICEFWYKK